MAIVAQKHMQGVLVNIGARRECTLKRLDETKSESTRDETSRPVAPRLRRDRDVENFVQDETETYGTSGDGLGTETSIPRPHPCYDGNVQRNCRKNMRLR